MREITLEEAESVGGAVGVPGAIVGGVAGGAHYLGGQTGGGSFNGRDFAVAVGVGAALGATAGTVGIGAAAGSVGLNYGGGMIMGNYGRLNGG
ncbi:hypothetical protein D3C77_185120 [compost metagenome]